ncbi:hypothetical protein [uncultured Draconibacterium sp.]|uniref:hypothetical protein n=1 Tax=uncultured Draconibacterium sp. TaxID=1573823 RepID=UPI0029C6F53C|nr:hypothetical protein [uncultured Draconibacterium sp.]
MSNSSSTLDIITILIASIALIISIITVIRQFFYKKFSFSGCLIQHKHTEGAFESCNLEYCVANTGNVKFILKEILVEAVNPPINISSPIINLDNIPVILKEEQMQLVQFSLPRFLVQKAAIKKFEIKITFIVVSPQGIIYTVPHFLSFLVNKELMNEAWKPFRLNTRRHEIKI